MLTVIIIIIVYINCYNNRLINLQNNIPVYKIMYEIIAKYKNYKFYLLYKFWYPLYQIQFHLHFHLAPMYLAP